MSALFFILLTAPVFHFTYPLPILVSILLFSILQVSFLGKLKWLSILAFILIPLLIFFVNLWIGNSTIASLSPELSLSSAQETYLSGAIRTNEQYATRSFYFHPPANILLLPIYYRLRPYFFEVSTFLDLILFSCNILCVFIFIRVAFLIHAGRRALSSQRRLLLLSILSLLPYDVIWSLGTVNWGTSARHASATTVLLLVLFSNYRASRRAVSSVEYLTREVSRS